MIRVLAGLFFISLAGPFVISLVTPDGDTSEAEKRTLQPWPHWSAAKSLDHYFGQLSNYANDHFGFREYLITAHKSLMWAANESPSKYVVRGENDWLFLKIKDPLLSEAKYSNETIREMVKGRVEHLTRMHSELTSRGIVYQHIVASNKMSVYSEYLPTIYRFTDVDATLSYFKSLVNDELIPLLTYTDAVVAKHKASGFPHHLYFKNDTHWNDLGAYKVFMEVVNKLATSHPEIDIQPLQRDFKVRKQYSGDLALYIGLSNKLSALEPRAKFLPCTKPKTITEPRWDLDLNECGTNETTLFIIGDSFLFNLYPFFSESVGRVYMVKQGTSRTRILQLIDDYKPDVVIEEIVERNLATQITR